MQQSLEKIEMNSLGKFLIPLLFLSSTLFLQAEVRLMGMVFDEVKAARANKVKVEVKNVVTKKKQTSTTNQTGRFVFDLKTGSRYRLTITQKDGTVLTSRPFATLNNKDGEMVHMIIQGNSLKRKKISQRIRTNLSKVTYKIHIGAFTKPFAANATFLTNLRHQVNAIPTTTGLTRYVVGNFNDLTTAKQYKTELENLGYKNAFIAAYKEEEWVQNWPKQS